MRSITEPYIKSCQAFMMNLFNPFSTNVPLLYPLKVSENHRFSDAFRGYRTGTLVENGLKGCYRST